MKISELRVMLATIILFVVAAVGAYMGGFLDGIALNRTRFLTLAESSNKWFGAEVQQFPSDLLILQELMWKAQPDVIIQTGTDAGGLTLFLATVQAQVRPEGRIYSVTRDTKDWDKTKEKIQETPTSGLLERITVIEGDSSSSTVYDQIAEQIKLGEEKVMVVLGTSTDPSIVFKELEKYWGLVNKGSFIVVQNTHFGEPFHSGSGEGPKMAIAQFLEKRENEFSAEPAYDRFVVSGIVGGVLVRK